MKKLSQMRHFKSFVALFAGAVLLITAAAASYVSSGGYTAYKDALKNLLTLDSYDLSMEANLSVPGYEQSSIYEEQYDKDGEVVFHKRYSDNGGMSYYGEGWTVLNPDNPEALYKTISNYERGTTNGTETVWNIDRSNYAGSGIVMRLPSVLTSNDETQQNRFIRLAEAAADLFVGDLKNNFVSTGTDENGYQGYRISLTEEQLPEIVRAGFDFIMGTVAGNPSPNRTIWLGSSDDLSIEQVDAIWNEIYALRDQGYPIVVVGEDFSLHKFKDYQEYYESEYFSGTGNLSDILAVMDGSPRISLAECEFSVDKDGALRYNRLACNIEFRDISGNAHEITFEVTINVSELSENGIPAPEIPQNATIYDYSMGTSDNNWAYTVTKNGQVVWSNDSESAAIARAYIEGLGAEERLDYLFSEIFGFSDIDPATVAESATLMHASGELEYYGEGFGLSADELYALLSDDLMEVYGVEVVGDNLTPASVDTEATE